MSDEGSPFKVAVCTYCMLYGAKYLKSGLKNHKHVSHVDISQDFLCQRKSKPLVLQKLFMEEKHPGKSQR